MTRICILMLGMHRSGTSALTRTISLLGAKLPDNLMSPASDNLRGFWESMPLAQVHERLLKYCQSAHDDWRKLPVASWSDEERARWSDAIQSVLIREYGSADLFIVKEPRICRFAPFFLEVLQTMAIAPRVVVPFRNPLEVAASLTRRNAFSYEKSLLLWLRHVLDAEAASRDIPRVFVSYDRLLSDWRGATAAIAETLGIRWAREADDAATDIETFLTPVLRHHVESGTDAQQFMGGWARDAFLALHDLEHNPGDQQALDTLWRIGREFDSGFASRVAGSTPFEGQLVFERHKSLQAEQRALREQTAREQAEQWAALEHAAKQQAEQQAALEYAAKEQAERQAALEHAAKEHACHQLTAQSAAKDHLERLLAAQFVVRDELARQLLTYERNSRSSRWLLRMMGAKLLNTPHNMAHRAHRSLRKRGLYPRWIQRPHD